MVYVDKIYEADKKAINHQFATKILYLMDDLRLNANEKIRGVGYGNSFKMQKTYRTKTIKYLLG